MGGPDATPNARRFCWARTLQRTLQRVFAVLLVAAVLVISLQAALSHLDGHGTHDWDTMLAHRYLQVKTYLRFGEFPFWDPYGCGGTPAWAGPESGLAASPVLPLYLLLPMPLAMRGEVLLVTLAGCVGMWRLAGTATRAPVLRALAVVLGILNSRWALQAAAGHAWHLYYALFPWTVWAALHMLARARRGWRQHGGFTFAVGALLAAAVYAGAIYPAPHAALAVGVLALMRAKRDRSLKPLIVAAASGLWAAALAAPRVVPLLDTMRRFPRHVSSTETTTPDVLWHALVGGARASSALEGLDYGYHEYGIYIGALGMALLGVGLYFRRRAPRVMHLMWTGVFFASLCQVIGPWFLLHKLPIFSSQHVPMRFLYPALILLSVTAMAGVERAMKAAARRWGAQALTHAAGHIVLAVAVATPIALENREILMRPFSLDVPHVEERVAPFAQVRDVPAELRYGVEGRSLDTLNGQPVLLARRANLGVLDCKTFGDMDTLVKPDGTRVRPEKQGARGRDEPDYRGEVFLEGPEEAKGEAKIVAWSPNRVSVEVTGLVGKTRLIVNQNWDPGWRFDGAPAMAIHARIAGEVQRDGIYMFRYRPRGIELGLTLMVLGAGVALGLWVRARTTRRQRVR